MLAELLMYPPVLSPDATGIGVDPDLASMGLDTDLANMDACPAAIPDGDGEWRYGMTVDHAVIGKTGAAMRGVCWCMSGVVM